MYQIEELLAWCGLSREEATWRGVPMTWDEYVALGETPEVNTVETVTLPGGTKVSIDAAAIFRP